MADFITSLCLICVVFLKVVSSNEDLSPAESFVEACTSQCLRKFNIDANSKLPANKDCARGCRYYAIAQGISLSKPVLDRENILETCRSTCHRAYTSDEKGRTACIVGCQLFPTPPVQFVPEFSWSLIVENENSIQVLQGDNTEPDDVLTDPSLRAQVSKMNRLPEMRVRTLPVSTVKEDVMIGWWGGCGGNGSRGVPHCLAASLLLLLILVALWFGLSLEDPRDDSSGISVQSPSLIKKQPPPDYYTLIDDEAPPLPQKTPLV